MSKSEPQVIAEFLGHLLSDLTQHLEKSNAAKLPQGKAKTEALQLVLAESANSYDFPTVVCTALQHTHNIGRSANAGLAFTSLVQYLKNSTTVNVGVVILCTSICSGWRSISNDSLVLDLATRILLSDLEKDIESTNCKNYSTALREAILIVLSSSKVRLTTTLFPSFVIHFHSSHFFVSFISGG